MNALVDMNTTNDLKDIFILRYTGECVYYQNYDNGESVQADQNLMSSFLSAIEIFSSEVDNNTEVLETTNYRFVYHRKEDFIYVARTGKKVNPSYISNKLKKVSNEVKKFIPEFWDGSIEPFEQARPIIQKYLYSSYDDKYYDIAGKYVHDLPEEEMKIYSYLRLKGRSNIKKIAQLMKIDDEKAFEIAEKLRRARILVAC